MKCLFCGTTNPQCDVLHILLCHKLWLQVHRCIISLCISDRFLFTLYLNCLSIHLFMHFNCSLCFVLFTYKQPCEHYRVHLYWVQVKLLWEGAIRDNRILVLVHSTKRESASLPITGATKGASQKWYHAYKKRQQGDCKMVGIRQRSLIRSSVNGDTKNDGFCVGDVAPELLSAFVVKVKKKI